VMTVERIFLPCSEKWGSIFASAWSFSRAYHGPGPAREVVEDAGVERHCE
jgi:hypothetical protein